MGFLATDLQVAAFRAADSDTSGLVQSLIAAPAAGLAIAVLTMDLTNTSSTDALVTIQSATNAIAYFSVAPDENVNRTWPAEAPLWCNAAEALQWITDAGLTTLYIDIQGVIAILPELTIA